MCIYSEQERGAPSRKGCVVNGQNTQGKQQISTPPPPRRPCRCASTPHPPPPYPNDNWPILQNIRGAKLRHPAPTPPYTVCRTTVRSSRQRPTDKSKFDGRIAFSHLEAERPRPRRRTLLDLDLELEGVLALRLRLGERDRLRESRPPPTPRWGRTC